MRFICNHLDDFSCQSNLGVSTISWIHCSLRNFARGAQYWEKRQVALARDVDVGYAGFGRRTVELFVSCLRVNRRHRGRLTLRLTQILSRLGCLESTYAISSKWNSILCATTAKVATATNLNTRSAWAESRNELIALGTTLAFTMTESAL